MGCGIKDADSLSNEAINRFGGNGMPLQVTVASCCLLGCDPRVNTNAKPGVFAPKPRSPQHGRLQRGPMLGHGGLERVRVAILL